MALSAGQVAFMPARLGVARLAATRLGYYQAIPQITIAGVDVTAHVRLSPLTITDLLNSTPNTATLRVWQMTPVKGQEIKFGLGGLGASQLEFAGHILATTQVYEAEKPAHVAWDLSCISYEWLLLRRKVTARYLSQSATDIILDLMANYSSGFSTAGVEAGLPDLDEITFTNEELTDCLDRVCERAGGANWYVDYGKVLRVFSTASGAVQDITDADVHGMSGLAVTVDLSQVRTRALGEGGGSNTSTDVAVGQDTIPVDDGTWYQTGGGTVVSGPQRITYTDKSTLDGTGSRTAGFGGLEPAAPTVAVATGTAGNIPPGLYNYQVSLVIDGGETAGGDISGNVTISHVAGPTGAASGTGTTGGSLTAGAVYYVSVTFVTAAGETVGSTNLTQVTLGGGDSAISLSTIPTSADGRVTGRNIYRTGANGTLGLLLDTVIGNNSATTATLTKADTALGAAIPNANTSGSGQINLTAVPTGPSGTSARRVYRSGPGDGDQRFVGTISNNTGTTFTDNVSNASRGSEVLTTATRTTPTLPSSTTLWVLELALYASGGGWVNVGGQLVRYTGRSGSSGLGTLTGVPSVGIGSITASIAAGTAARNAPHLTGVSGILYAINRGEPVNLFVTRNDTAAQTVMAGLVGGDGIHEEFIQDRRLSYDELVNRLDAVLLERADPIVSARYQTRDKTSRSGFTVTISLGAPTNISGTFQIQRVTTTSFEEVNQAAVTAGAVSVWPLRTVEASSRLFTFEQLLRIVKAA